MSATCVVSSSAIVPTPDNLAEFLPYACEQLMAPFTVRCRTLLQEMYINKSDLKQRKSHKVHGVHTSRLNLNTSSIQKLESITTKNIVEDEGDPEALLVEAVIDSAEHLVEISIGRCSAAPRWLMQIISLCIPFNPHLNKITMRCKLSGATLHDTVKLLTLAHITDVCLDDSRNRDRNYYVLLECQTHLQSLSLARCKINDDDCSLLFSKLEYSQPASKTLQTLNIMGNCISDKGAICISQALRSNRSLLYLNLSGNTIGDDGALRIFSSLMEFRMTDNEIIEKRRRLLYLLKSRREIYAKIYAELLTNMALETTRTHQGTHSSRRKHTPHTKRQIASIHETNGSTRNSQVDQVALKAEMMTAELIDLSTEPFRVEATVFKDNCLFSTGNLTLTYLNLAYNHLGYLSVSKLLEVVRYQVKAAKHPNFGLLSVQLDGNPLPACTELKQISDILHRVSQAQFLYSSLQTPGGRTRVDKFKKQSFVGT